MAYKRPGRVFFNITHSDTDETIMAFVQIKDKTGNIVGNKTTNIIGSYDYIDIEEPNLWWPYLMHTEPGYLYTLEVCINIYKFEFN